MSVDILQVIRRYDQTADYLKAHWRKVMRQYQKLLDVYFMLVCTDRLVFDHDHHDGTAEYVQLQLTSKLKWNA